MKTVRFIAFESNHNNRKIANRITGLLNRQHHELIIEFPSMHHPGYALTLSEADAVVAVWT